ncbi:bacteriophage abortive infection AbiH family protein [Muriicola sp. Z0-33]|uniref:bacteriophage abortive infection AbiH family protein n=1 Tax=Muriicola sp. Z0-33 TaxID=2816957 RepID=UPI0022382D71|nr:bacteriophage abortive infection AbiH family protein [Muriicola sp. Z0-33]MCW5514729.1 hypothetical protein [Muriicola sp. Z0-33]
MNKLIILGNGFDLSHGLNTSYSHFIEYLINESIQYNDDIRRDLIDVGFLMSENQSFEFIKENYIRLATFPPSPTRSGRIIPKNKLFHMILKKFFEADWVDIEGYYFKVLTETEENQIDQLNIDFEIIKKYLLHYLKNRIATANLKLIPDYFDIFNENNPSRTLFLNFNYTETIKQYLKTLSLPKIDLINIHGNLLNIENPMVFGCGDDTDPEYIRLIDKNNNSYLRNLKRQQYNLASSYAKLLEFLNSVGEFEVYTLGHSLGLTDKTLLSEILNDNGLKRLKLFYYKDRDGYRNLNNNIRRIVTNDVFNNKILSFPNSIPIPQST